MDIDAFIRARPCLWHLTSRANAFSIRQRGEILSTSELLRLAGRADEVAVRRRGHLRIEVEGKQVLIRDQDPLHEGNIAFESGWDMPRLCALLNSQVFFWPGDQASPIDDGKRHFERYRGEENSVVRVATRDFLGINQAGVRFSRWNSGSPRCVNGRPSPRGAATFLSSEDFANGPGDVKELVVQGCARLPGNAIWKVLS